MTSRESDREVSALRERLSTITQPSEDHKEPQRTDSLSKKSYIELVEKYAELKGGLPVNFDSPPETYMNRMSPLIEHDEIHCRGFSNDFEGNLSQEPSKEI